MKRTQFEDLIGTIRATIVSFISIAMFVALAVAIYLGIQWSGTALLKSGEQTFAENSFHDIEILYPYGVTDDDIEALRGVEGVSEVEGSQVSFQNITVKDGSFSMRLGQLGASIDKLQVVEGALPAKSGELALEKRWAARHEVKVGDTLRLEAPDSSSDQLTESYYTVTALVESPAYVSNSANTWGSSTTSSGSIDVLAWTVPESFDSDAYQNGHTVVEVRSDALRAHETSDPSYKDAAETLANRIDDFSLTRSNARHQALVDDAQAKVDDAQRQLDDANQKIADGEQAIADGEQQIVDGEAKIRDGESELASKQAEFEQAKADGQAQLDEKYAQLSSAQDAYNNACAQFDARQAEFNDVSSALDAQLATMDPMTQSYEQISMQIAAMREGLLAANTSSSISAVAALDQGLSQIDPSLPDQQKSMASIAVLQQIQANGRSEIEGAAAQLAEKRAALDSGAAQLQEAQNSFDSQVADAERQLADGRAQLQDARNQLAEARQTLAEKRQELEDAKAELAEKTPELEDAKDKLQKVKDNPYEWTVLARSDNGGVVSLESFNDITLRLCRSMASLFVLVGLFVCYSAVSRLVREHVRQIGTKKALGLRAREITLFYLLYTTLAVVLGVLLGLAGAVLVVERIIIPVLSASFYMKVPAYWSASTAAVFALFELVLVLASTWLACHTVLRRHAVELLAGETPPDTGERFFERWPLWQRMSLYAQTTVNNLLNDRRRVLATMVGVAGCTALVVCAITLNDDVVAGVRRQYEKVYHYNTVIRVNTSEEGALEQAEQAVRDLGCAASTPVATRSVMLIMPDDSSMICTITVPQDQESFSRLMTVTSLSGETAGAEVAPGNEGLWMSVAYGNHYAAHPGDKIKIIVGDGTEYTPTIAGLFDHYLAGHQAIMSKEYYQEVFGSEATPTKLLVDTGDVSVDELKEALADKSYIASVADDRADQETLFNSFRKVSRVVVLVYLALSIAMAVVVLLNLNVMFVEEKRRELITLMVCGYDVKDAKGYIWHDNVVLTVLGVNIGIGVGMVAGYLSVQALELANVNLVKDIVPRACLIGAAASLFLSALMTLIALRIIPRLELSDINRT